MGSMCSKSPVVLNDTKPSKNQIVPKNSKYADIHKKFQFCSLLDIGAFGIVRLFKDRSTPDMKYAVRTIKKEGMSKSLYDCLVEEVSILQELDNPNIIKYYETFEDDLYIHLVMEYFPGDDLFEAIGSKSENISEIEISQIIFHLLQVLMFLHNKYVVHRDIKPQNILFGVKGDFSTLKIIDFGLSTHKCNKINSTVKSPHYMAPEIINGTYTYKTDLWSVGVILYVMLTGKFPFNGSNKEELFHSIQHKAYDHLSLKKANCSEEAKDLVSKLIVKDPKERLSSEEALDHPWFKNELNTNTVNVIDNDTVELVKSLSKKNNIQKEIFFCIAKITQIDEIIKVKQVFTEMDTNSNGKLTMEKIQEGLTKIGIKASEDEYNEIFAGLHFHMGEEINYTELLTDAVAAVTFRKEEKIWSVFKYFESSSDSGYISLDFLVNTLRSFSFDVNEDEVNKLFEDLQMKGKKFDFEEFKHMVGCSL